VHAHDSKLIDNMGKIACNGERAFKLSWLIGEGLNFNLYTKWMDNYDNTKVRLRYFQGATSVAINDMAACTCPPGFSFFSSSKVTGPHLSFSLSLFLYHVADNIDFGGISTPLSEAQQAAQPDVVPIPIIAYAAGPAYNVRFIATWLLSGPAAH
jgi:hypothetical protein